MVDSPTLAGADVWYGQDLEEPLSFSAAGGQLCVFTHRAPGKSGSNEDALGFVPISDDTVVLILTDGLGGQPGGHDAARMVVENLIATLRSAGELSLREAILDGIEAANRAILETRSGSAATIAVAEITPQGMRPYHVGDSLILLTGQRGALKFQSIAHSPIGYAVESGLIDEDDAVHHEERNLVSNVVGDSEMRIEVGPYLKLAARDTLLLASDGLPDNLYIQEIIEAIRTGPLLDATRRLHEETHRRMQDPQHGHSDDTSYLLFRPRSATRKISASPVPRA